MKTRIVIIALITISFGIKAQEKIQTQIGLKNDFIYKTGRIGIGTVNPSAKLDIFNPSLFNTNMDATSQDHILLSSNEAGNGNYFGGITWQSGGRRRASIAATREHADADFVGIAFFTKGVDGPGPISESMRVNRYGNVGIGATNPSAKLDVRNGHLYVGDESFSNPSSWGQTINIDDNIHSRILIEERQTGVQTTLWSHTGGNSKVGTISDHDFGIMTKGSTKIMVKKNGNIGIGTTEPKEALTLSKPGVSLGIYDTNPLSKANNRIARYSNSLVIQNDFSGSWKDNINFFDNGKVGVGTRNTGNHKLAVEGSIGAREIKVEAFPNWSDFVFEKEYDLPTLTEVENHIKEKGHLKDIPSAKEVKKDGFFLGEMDAKLLQKIEELTLYTIEQEKKINSLEKQSSKIEKQQKEIDQLKLLVQKLLK